MTKQRQRLETLLLKLTRQEEELKRKIEEVNAKIKAEKNTEITGMVDVFDLTPEELKEVLLLYKDGKEKELTEQTKALAGRLDQKGTIKESEESEERTNVI